MQEKKPTDLFSWSSILFS